MTEPNKPHVAPPSPPGDVTRLLIAWNGGDAKALERLIPLVYGELRRQARDSATGLAYRRLLKRVEDLDRVRHLSGGIQLRSRNGAHILEPFDGDRATDRVAAAERPAENPELTIEGHREGWQRHRPKNFVKLGKGE